jgi:alkylation response protein AidB-like acyl-CoA dehydrogenase
MECLGAIDMDFGFTEDEEDFRARVRMLLREPPISNEVARVGGSAAEPDERVLYRSLGAAGLLGVSWPRELGGQDRSAVELLIVTEELVRAGIPDTLYVNSILTVGNLILSQGTDELKRRLLPGLAAGRLFASILYSEPEAGSDLGSLATSAVADDTGSFRINGTKIFSLKSGITDIGLCAVRTSRENSKYGGITLFIVDMRAPGVTITPLPSLPTERFHLVELDEVQVRACDAVGDIGAGWGVISQGLPLERTGLDFALRAEQWYRLAADDPGPPETAGQRARYAARVEAARLLGWRAALDVAGGRIDHARTATAKWYSSEVAAELAGWLVRRRGLHGAPALADAIDRAYREAPGLTLAGGTSEMMLQLLAAHLIDDLEESA